jgi:glutathione S-transferase
MVQLVVYGSKKQFDVMTVLALLEELELKYVLKAFDTNVNKFGDVPTVMYGDIMLTGMSNILRHVAKANEPDLYLSHETDMWLYRAEAHFGKAVKSFVDGNKSELVRILKLYNEHLNNKMYLMGDFSIADIAHIGELYELLLSNPNGKYILKKYNNVYEWAHLILRYYLEKN